MVYLLLVSLIWAFSFGLIKGSLTDLDSNLVAFIRLLISLIFFLPFLRIKNIGIQIGLKLIMTGAVQFGIMYSFYIYSYKYLQAHEVALFTVLTPIYVTLFNDLFNKKINKIFLLTSLLAVIGTAIAKYDEINTTSLFIGFILVQISNICFAFGQIYYSFLLQELHDVKDHNIFALLYLGAVIITSILTFIFVDFQNVVITGSQIYTLIYLGVVASGLAFFLWNYGARRTNAGALAIFNNLKLPLAIAVSLLVFNETTNVLNLISGGIIIIGSLLLNQYFLASEKVH
jgi:carboxylate/amino acid/amine transporter